jgi:hypothetical protein
MEKNYHLFLETFSELGRKERKEELYKPSRKGLKV